MEKRQQHATRSGISAVTICRRSICIILLVGIGCPVGYYASIGWTLYRARVPKSVYWQPWKCAEETSLSIPIYRGVKNLEWLQFFPQLRKLSLYASQDFRRCLDDVDGLQYCSKLEDLSFSDTEIRNLPDGLLMLPPLPSLKILTLTDFGSFTGGRQLAIAGSPKLESIDNRSSMRKIILTQQQLHLTSIENDGDGDYGTVMEFSAAAPRLAVLEGVDTVTGWTYLPNLEHLGLAVDAVVDIPSMARLKVVRSAGKEVRLQGAFPALTYYESDGPCQNSLSGSFPKLRRVAVTPEGHPADHVHLTLEGEFPNLLKLEAECDVQDWSFLKGTPSLRSLKAEECHALESLSVLNELRLLALKNVRSLDGLSGVHSLQALDIEGESIRGADVSLHLAILRLAVNSLEGVDSFRPSKLQIAGIRPHIEPIQVAEFDWLESLDHLDSLSIAGCHLSVLLGSGLKWPSSWPTVDTLRFLDWAPLSEGATLDLRSAEPARVFCGPRINSFSQINTGPQLRHLSVAIVGVDEGLGAFRNLDSLQVRENEGWAPLESFRRLAGMHYLRKNLLVRVPAEASRLNQDFHTFVAQGTADWLLLDYLHTNPSDNPVEFIPSMYRDLSPPSNRDELAYIAARAGLKESDLFRAVTISAGKSATDLRSIVADADAAILTDVSVIPDLGSAQIDSLELRFADWGQYSEAGMYNSLPRLQAIRGLKRLVLRNVGDVILHLDELGSLPELESLTLSGAFGICDFEGLDNFPQLKSLTLEGAAFGSADSFPDHGHEHLTDLTLIDCKSAPGEPFLRRLFPSLKTFRLGRE